MCSVALIKAAVHLARLPLWAGKSVPLTENKNTPMANQPTQRSDSGSLHECLAAALGPLAWTYKTGFRLQSHQAIIKSSGTTCKLLLFEKGQPTHCTKKRTGTHSVPGLFYFQHKQGILTERHRKRYQERRKCFSIKLPGPGGEVAKVFHLRVAWATATTMREKRSGVDAESGPKRDIERSGDDLKSGLPLVGWVPFVPREVKLLIRSVRIAR